jgi:flagellin
MGMVIGTNVASITAQRHLESSRASMETSMERLASGSRINSAMDDAAGMAIVHKMDSKISGLNQAVRNANDGISMISVAEGAMEEMGSMLNRMKELAVQATNDTYTATDRDAMDLEFQALAVEITRVAADTDFNDIAITNSATVVKIQVGDDASDTISITPILMTAVTLGITATTTLQDDTTSPLAITAVDTAIAALDTQRGKLGAVANTLSHTVSNLMSRVEHQSAARSQIQDTDFAAESANLAKAQVLQQAGTAMLSQANASGQSVLSLLK